MSTPVPLLPTYGRGHVTPPDLLVQKELSKARMAKKGRSVPVATESEWDSRTKGWIPPIKNQASCGCMPGTDEVLTEKGWKKWEDYDFVTPLGTMNQLTGFLEFQAPLQRHVYDYDGPLYYSENRSVDFALTPNHRLYARKWNEAKRMLDDHYQFTKVEDAGWYMGLPHATTGWAGTELKKLGVGGREYDGDDFLALIALVISDGWAAGPDSTERSQVGFCCFREDRINFVRELAQRLGLHEQPSRPGYWLWNDGALAEWFRKNAYDGTGFTSPHKHVPALVKVASQRQIDHFLKFFGDQHIQKEGTRRFYSSSRLMIDDLQELLLRVGKRGTIEERPPRETTFKGRVIKSNGPDLTLTDRKSDKLSLDKKRHLRTDHYKGKVYCATVPNSTLVTRRNGTMLISGNSCWDFSGVGIVEIALIKAGIIKGDGSQALSEEYVLDCIRTGGCNGDDNTTVLKAAKANGLPFTSDYGPYTAGNGRTGKCKYKSTMKLVKIDDWGFCDNAQGSGVTDIQTIKNYIKDRGAVGCAVAANSSWDNYTGGIHTGNSTEIDHDVVLVGWKDDPSVHGGGYWIMRNSWDMWGIQGYMWIAYGADSIGTEAVFAAVNSIIPDPIDIDWRDL